MRKKQIWARIMAMAMSASMVAGSCPATVSAVTGSTVAADGTYSNTVHVQRTAEDDEDENEWNEYDVNVSLTVQDGVFSDITVKTANGYETTNDSYLAKAYTKNKGIKTLLEGAEATETTINNWDSVSGATRTSEAVKAAALAAVQAAPEKVVGADPAMDTSEIEAEIAKAEGLTEEVYTAESWSSMKAELQEAKDALAEAKSQASLEEAVTHLKEAVEALQSQYVLMNIPYAEFYQADVVNDIEVDAFTSATLNKTRTGSLSGGSYHVNSDGTDITGVTFPVKLGEGVDLSQFTQVTDENSVDIQVTNRGTTTTTTYAGKDALFESASYSYYVLNELPAYYKEVTADAEGTLNFGKVVGEVQKAENVDASLVTSTSYGDYQLSLDGLTDIISTDSQVYGVIISTEEGQSYGLRHLENIWRVSELAWCTGFTEAVHNCPTSSEHYEAMMGQTIDKATYYTSQGIYQVALNEYVPVKFQSDLTVADAELKAGKTAVTFESKPSDYDAQYSVDGLSDMSIKDGELTFTAGNVGSYTLNVTDKSGKYADVSTSFTLTSAENPAVYEEEQKALVKKETASDADFANYIKNITSVSVNGTAYPASGRGAVAVIKEDGSLIVDAAPFAEAKAGDSFEIIVTSAGYTTDIAFTYLVEKQEAQWVKDGNHYKYLNEDGTYSTSKWQTIDGKVYYFGADGYMVTGWKNLNGKWYYMKKSGEMATGWELVDKKWYYMKKSGEMATGWELVDKKWYYMNKSGAMTTGWQKVDNKWYYMNKSGAMTTGWQKVDNKWYYMNKSGAMTTGWQKVDNKWYYMNGSGVMLTNQLIGRYYVNGSGVWTETK